MHSPAGASPLGGLHPHYWELPQQTSLKGDVSHNDRAFRGCPSTLAVWNERPLAVRTYRTYCLTRPAVLRENQFASSTMGRNYFSIYIKPHEVDCQLQKYIYLLTYINCSIQYVAKSVTPLNLTKNEQSENRKIRMWNFYYHCNDIFKNATFSVRVSEKLPANGYVVVSNSTWRLLDENSLHCLPLCLKW